MPIIMDTSTLHTVTGISQRSKVLPIQNIDQLSNRSDALLKNIVSSEKSLERRLRFKNKIQNLVNSYFPDKKITTHLYGSSITGLDLGGSDCDIEFETDHEDSEVTVNALAKMFRTAGMRHVIPISGARVPIVKFYDPHHHISCDITVNNILGVHNSQMIKAYLSIDDRVKKLIILIKHWAKRRGINSSNSGTYSSYCYVLMTIFFLQNLEEPILPSLQQISQELNEERNIVSILVNQRNKRHKSKTNSPKVIHADVTYFKDLGLLSLHFKKSFDLTHPSALELFHQFCIFYTRDIDTSKSVASIRTGKLEPMKKTWKNHGYLLHIEDPFDLERNVACTASIYGETKLTQEMNRVISLFEAGDCTLEVLFEKAAERPNLKETGLVEAITDRRLGSTIKSVANNNSKLESVKPPFETNNPTYQINIWDAVKVTHKTRKGGAHRKTKTKSEQQNVNQLAHQLDSLEIKGDCEVSQGAPKKSAQASHGVTAKSSTRKPKVGVQNENTEISKPVVKKSSNLHIRFGDKPSINAEPMTPPTSDEERNNQRRSN